LTDLPVSWKNAPDPHDAVRGRICLVKQLR
jgi:hypothetical protein